MKPCRECQHVVSQQARACPSCGAPWPAKQDWDGYGYEFKSKAHVAGMPLLHVSFKYRPSAGPVPARGVIAIGQFACGIVTVSQFGVGLVSVSQFALAGFALAQIGVAYSLVAQIGLFVDRGYGQLVKSFSSLLGG